MRIDIISDAVCPWCWVGKRRLEKALAQRPDLTLEITWRPYQLNPELPPEGRDRRQLMREKFGDGDRAKQVFQAIKQAGEAEDIPFDFDVIERSPNTLAAHRLIRWAAGAGVQDCVVEGLFAAYFAMGRDIGDTEVLMDVATGCGMDGALVGELLDDERDREMVIEEIDIARRMGVTGVPFFVFDGKYAVSGAQDPAVFLQVIDRALAEVGAAG